MAQTPEGKGPLYVDSDTVRAILDDVDVLAPIRSALIAYSEGTVLLPEEAYLGWSTADGEHARSICLPAAIPSDDGLTIGLKVINGSLSNTRHGLPRASGLAMLFDPETARVRAVMACACLSSTRTAAVSYLAVEACAVRREVVGLVGCGVLGARHMDLLLARGGVARILLFDTDVARAESLARRLVDGSHRGSCVVEVVDSANAAVARADVVVTATTTTEGYIAAAWLRPGTVLVHVSLDDVLPEVVETCGWLVVDSWRLVSADRRRILGRMVGEGRLVGPDASVDSTARRVDAELGDVLAGRRPGRSSEDDVVLVNPFGMGAGDIAIMSVVHAAALRLGVGTWLAP
jgi:N-[(2S)-2-amino-2-carboxyethyl]-L-glutamate dehydrogenase